MRNRPWPGLPAPAWVYTVIVLFGLLLPWSVQARELIVQVVDAHGKPLEYAAVLADWDGGQPNKPGTQPVPMIQKDLRFQPHMMIVPKGAEVTFPNYDRTRHHVYSFSKAKTFDIKLYVGRPDRPITLDKAGVVTVGCNIHDQMQAFIVVNDKPAGAVTDGAGYARLKNVPDKPITLSIWHPWMASEQARTQRVVAPRQTSLTVMLDVDPPPPLQRGGHDSLQDRFDQLSGQQ